MGERNEPGNFTAMLESNDGVCVVTARGELDLGSYRELKDTLDEAIVRCGPARGVVADLSDVEFMESVTLGALVEQRDELREAGKELVLVIRGSDSREDHPVGRLLHLAGQAGEFSVYDGRTSAIESIRPDG